MDSDRLPRKLAAILYADVAGYSRLTGDDEDATHRRLRDYLDLIAKTIDDHHGQVMHYAGDAVLAKFDAVVDALSSAVAVQEELKNQNSDLPDERKVQFRIGVNLGDVIEDRGDIYGDGVNVAARLENLADAGGICISESIRTAIGKKLDLVYESMGEQEVKNIEEPVRAYKVVLDSEEKTQVTAEHRPTLELPDKPSIAVLPFTNMSGDPEQEYFSDGITEDIITELSRFPVLFVIARHSSFAFKGEKVDIKEVGEKLGVQYVVEGSVRRAGNRVRITAQLIEAETGHHVWAERYDRELEDIFAVQDEVTRSIVAVLPGRVQEDVAERASRKPTDNMKAYEFMLQAKSIRDSFGAEDTARARRLFEKAIELDPRYSKAYMYLADTYLVDILLGIETEDAAEMQVQLTRKAASLDSNDLANQEQLGYAYITEGMWEDAGIQFDKTLSKIVNEAEQMLWCGYGLMMLGRPEEARDIVLEAMRLDPLHPHSYDWVLGQAYYFAKCYEDVIRVLMGETLLNSLAYGCLVGAYAHLGRIDDARTALESFVTERHREFSSRNIVVEGDTIDTLAGGYRKMWRQEADWDHFADGLRKAGLPD